MSQKPTGSAYFLEERKDTPEKHTLSILVDNEPGVLSRIAGLLSGRGYNIDSLTVSETEHEKHLSRFTIVTTGTPMVLEQVKNQLERMVPVHRVVDLTVVGEPLERELALVKVSGTGEKRIEALRLAEIFRASVIDASTGSLCLRDHRALVQDRAVHRHHEGSGVGRDLPHRHRRHGARTAGHVMQADLLAALVAFCIVTLITPGPNNVMLMASGLNFGFRRAQPHLWGVTLGFAVMVLAVGLGLGAVFAAWPSLYVILKYAGAAYLLYLAWLIATAEPVEPGEAREQLAYHVPAGRRLSVGQSEGLGDGRWRGLSLCSHRRISLQHDADRIPVWCARHLVQCDLGRARADIAPPAAAQTRRAGLQYRDGARTRRIAYGRSSPMPGLAMGADLSLPALRLFSNWPRMPCARGCDRSSSSCARRQSPCCPAAPACRLRHSAQGRAWRARACSPRRMSCPVRSRQGAGSRCAAAKRSSAIASVTGLRLPRQTRRR